MKVSVRYGKKTFGNESPSGSYGVAVASSSAFWGPDCLQVSFTFGQPAKGRGVGPGSGSVIATHLVIPRADAHRIAVAILTQFERPRAKPLKLRFKGGAERERIRALEML